jgi:hypothetical protein
MTPAPTGCNAPGCTNPVTRRTGPGRPAIYCSPACRTSPRRPGVLVEVDHPDISPDGRPVRRVWSVRLRRGQHVVVIANDLGWPSAQALAGALNDLLHPGSPRKGGPIE